MTRIKAVIFDLDGVLADSEWQYYLRTVDFLRENGVESSEDILLKLVGMTWQEYVGTILSAAKLDWTEAEYERRHDAYVRRVGELHYSQCLFSDAASTLDCLAQAGYLLGLASSSPRTRVLGMLRDCGFTDTFHCVLSREDVVQSKPAPEIYRTAAWRLGLSPGECLAVEDSVYGIRAALDAGMRVAAKRSPHYELDQSAAQFHIQELAELPPLLERLAGSSLHR